MGEVYDAFMKVLTLNIGENYGQEEIWRYAWRVKKRGNEH